MTDYVWCGKCQSYTPSIGNCPFCLNRKDTSRRLEHDYGSMDLPQVFNITLDNGERISFDDNRKGKSYFCREYVSSDDCWDDTPPYDSYEVHDTSSLSMILGESPDDKTAEHGVADCLLYADGDNRTVRYTRDPTYIQYLNRKPRAVYKTPSSRVNRTGSLNRKPKKKDKKGRC